MSNDGQAVPDNAEEPRLFTSVAVKTRSAALPFVQRPRVKSSNTRRVQARSRPVGDSDLFF
ncbi:MAG: hypothetical protein LBK25_06765 [Treponema sp.]|nr:hypothetical protein [Treponema sp.]